MAITTSLVKFVLFSLLLVSTCTTSAAWNTEGRTTRPSRDTNGNRLARGLAPLPPKRLYNATRAGAAPARRSTTPIAGQIAVTAVGGTAPFCWLGTSQSCQTKQSSAVTFTPSAGVGAATAQELVINSGSDNGVPMIVGEYSNAKQGLGTGTYLYIAMFLTTEHTAPGAEPSYDSIFGFYYESSVWTINAQGEIEGTWVNSDGTSVSLIIFVDGGPTTYYIYATANPAYLATQSGATVVTLQYIQ